MIGRVVSTKTKNTATVLVERVAMDPLYKKTYAQSKKYLVDTKIDLKDGDVVEIVKIKPVSKNKHWKVVKVVGKDLVEIIKAKQKETAEEAIAKVMPVEETKEPSDVSHQTEKAIKKEEKPKHKKERKSLKAED
jgi:small subunit ribosomal protein S17